MYGIYTRHQRTAAPVIHFTDQQMRLLRELATPLAPSQRSAFLQEVARRLHGPDSWIWVRISRIGVQPDFGPRREIS